MIIVNLAVVAEEAIKLSDHASDMKCEMWNDITTKIIVTKAINLFRPIKATKKAVSVVRRTPQHFCSMLTVYNVRVVQGKDFLFLLGLKIFAKIDMDSKYLQSKISTEYSVRKRMDDSMLDVVLC